MFTPDIDFLRMEPKPFCLHKTEGANNDIKQGDACFFARNPIAITYNQVTAMFTDPIPTFSHMLKISEYVTLSAKRKCHPPGLPLNKHAIARHEEIGGYSRYPLLRNRALNAI